MSKPPYTATNESITVVWEGKPHVVKAGSANFNSLRKAILEEDWEAIPGHLTITKSISSWSNDKFKVEGDEVSYLGNSLPSSLSSRIRRMAANGEDPTPFFNFWERLKKNPSKRSVDQLYPFLEHERIPITPDGCFLAYKGVKNNFTDCHTGTISNKPGNTVELDRNTVSDDPKEACHFGLHVGAINYASSFGPVVVVCKVDPENVVCVPYDSSQEKMRVCKYEVIGLHGSDLPSTTYDDKEPPELEEEEQEPALEDEVESEQEVEEEDEVEEDEEENDDEADEKIVEELVREDENVKVVDVPSKQKDNPKVRVTKDKTKTKSDFRRHKAMDAAKLIVLSIDELRKYATYGLSIVGASKIPGGKTALIKKILRVRK